MPTPFHIEDVTAENEAMLSQLARLMVAAFAGLTPSWPDEGSGREEVEEVIQEGFGRAAVTPKGKVLGWIGGLPQYDGHVWELHPLAVDPAYQGQGIGRALVADFEEQVRQRGGLTIYLGTDDETGRTNLGEADLFADPWGAVARIQNPGGHPYEFYQKVGFTIVGVVPDANGPGKPDIMMAKRVGPRPTHTQS